MMTRTNVLALLLLALAPFALGLVWIQPARFATAGPSFLLDAGMEADDATDAAVWDSVTGTIDWNYTTSPAPLVGSASAYLDSGDVLVKELGGLSFVSAAGVFAFPDVTPASATIIAGLYDADGFGRMYLSLRPSGEIRGYYGASFGVAGAFSNGAVIYWRIDATRVSDGADIVKIWIGTSPTWSSSGGNLIVDVTNATISAVVDEVRVMGTAEGAIADKIRADDVALGNY